MAVSILKTRRFLVKRRVYQWNGDALSLIVHCKKILPMKISET